ncbi:MAG: hypothetical protein COA42_15790 [Alteromonadaceae bacterium]|nr:MAG: hypothetical protein COA42_15790 [Alteromonadaceae bacterium]
MPINSHLYSIHPWVDFDAKWLRDLAWLLLSPPLFTCELSGFKAFTPHDDKSEIYDWLKQLELTGHACETAPPQPTDYRRLGLYFEALLRFFFIQGRHDGICQYRLIANNIPIYRNKITLGEMDFVLEDKNSDIIHLETAVKFYLYCDKSNLPSVENTPPSWHHWIGPNARDRLDIKLARMISHQLALPSKTESQKTLDDLNTDPTSIQSQHLICGRLYRPLFANEALPEHSNHDAITGNWLHIQNAEKLLQFKDYQWVVLEKMDWLNGETRNTHQFTSPEILHWLKQLANATLPETSTTKNPHKHWLPRIPLQLVGHDLSTNQQQAIMIVNEHWPNTI